MTVVGERLGPFEIREILGEGGSAIVYASVLDGREIALKVLRPELELDPREVDRFVQEAGRMRRVRHPSLVPVVDVGMLPDGRPYIAMPRLVGRTLAERLAEGPIPAARAVAMFEDVASAVSELHRAGLVHRDIKPENVLWVDGEDRLVLLDLGIAREADAVPSTTTKAGLTRGTPAYMAPERFFGSPATERTDVYELALLFYMMLVGRLPWDEQDPRGRMTPRSPGDQGVPVTTALARVVLRALSVDFDARPRSVDDFVREVRDAAAEPSPDTAPATRFVAASGARPSALEQAPTQISPPAGVAVGSPTMQSAGGAQATAVAVFTGPPPEPRRGSPMAMLAVGAAIALAAAGAGVFASSALRSTDASPRAASPPTGTPTATSPEEPSPMTSAVLAELVAPAPTGSPSAPAPHASGSAPAPTAAPVASANPKGAASASASPAGGGARTPTACNNLVALMCSPSSGATPAECTAWKNNVANWQRSYPPDVARDTCQSAFNASANGLELRRRSKPP
jgi:serine/threonine-protein kinase